MPITDPRKLIILGVIAVLLVAAIGLLMASPLGQNVQLALNNFGATVTTFIGYMGPYIKFGRRLLNNFVFSGFEWLISAVVWISVVLWIFKFTVVLALRLFRSTSTE